MTKGLDDFVNEGWHFLWGVSNNRPIAARNPNSDVQSVSYDPRVGRTSMLNANAAFRLPIRTANLGGDRTYEFEGDSVYFYLRDDVNDNSTLISEGKTLEPDKGLIRKVSVFKSMREEDKWELISPERKIFGFVLKQAQYKLTQKGKQYFSPIYADADGAITTESNNAQRLLGFHLEFPDHRWDTRGGTTTQYMIVLRENAHRELQTLIQNDPFTLFNVYAKAFPHFVQAKGDVRGRYLEHPKISRIFYVESTPDFKRVQ